MLGLLDWRLGWCRLFLCIVNHFEYLVNTISFCNLSLSHVLVVAELLSFHPVLHLVFPLLLRLQFVQQPLAFNQGFTFEHVFLSFTLFFYSFVLLVLLFTFLHAQNKLVLCELDIDGGFSLQGRLQSCLLPSFQSRSISRSFLAVLHRDFVRCLFSSSQDVKTRSCSTSQQQY